MFGGRILCLALLAALPAMAAHAQDKNPAPAAKPATPATPATPAGAPRPPNTPITPGAKPARPSAFDEIDTNHDGFISRDEFLAYQKKRFDEFDTNHDGKIDAKEVASSPPLMQRNLEMADRMIKQWDANGDGIVTAEEFKKFSEDRFAKQDKAGTGKIPRPTPPTAAPGQTGKPGMLIPPSNSQQPVQLHVNPAPNKQPAQPQPQPPSSQPQH